MWTPHPRRAARTRRPGSEQAEPLKALDLEVSRSCYASRSSGAWMRPGWGLALPRAQNVFNVSFLFKMRKFGSVLLPLAGICASGKPANVWTVNKGL